jgi:hypothetical protein
MISLCTVELNGMEPFMELFLKSIVRHTKLISEVLIAKVDAIDNYKNEDTKGNVKIVRFGHPLKRTQQGVEHALGLHACIAKAKNDYILLSDPDIIYYNPVEELYLNLMNKHDLSIVGASHHSATIMAYSFFPWIGNCLIKKSELPGDDFLKGYLKDGDQPLDGKFLIPNKIEKFADLFPNPKGHFDTGSNLTLWNKFKNGKWLAFQTPDCHNYTTNFCRGNIKLNYRLDKMKLFYHLVGFSKNNFGLKERFKKERLLYHLGSGSRGNTEELDTFKKAYEDG